MSRQQVLGLGTAVVLITLFLVGCGSSAPTPVAEAPAATSTPEQPTATLTPKPPTATPTPVPPTATPAPLPGPKAGYWEGKEDSWGYEVTTRFTVTTSGGLSNFEVSIKLPDLSTCSIKAEKVSVETDDTFGLTQSVLDTASGKKEEAVDINGVFNSTTNMTGTLIVNYCEDQKLWEFDSEGKLVVRSRPLSAEWKGP